MKICSLLILALLLSGAAAPGADVLIEAEGFADTGGWTVDQQSMDQMGSPYLLAHGLGRPVADATSAADFPGAGEYRVWVRTRDWVAPWKAADTPPAMRAEGAPGAFRLAVDGKDLAATFGTQGAEWHWQDGGVVRIGSTSVTLALRDLTGFAGRCDAILFRTQDAPPPPDGGPELERLRRALSGQPEEPADAGSYDLVVVGGGMAGCCAAVSAARRGLRVALIQDRPVLGGNNSSEVRVGLSGLIHQQPYPRLGDLVDELGPVGHWNLWEAQRAPDTPRSKRILDVIAAHPEKKIHNAGPASNYEDQRKIDVVRAQTNVTLVLNARVNGAAMDNGRITSVVAQDIRTGAKRRFAGRVFADCTGDGNLGALAGADFRQGRESKAETGEDLAPESGDQLVMGTSVQWYADQEKEASTFPACPWAVRFDAATCIQAVRGDWNWETGATRDQVAEIERIRDYALRVVYGNWTVLKNDPRFKNDFARRRLAWVACIGGKRESRRLMGDVVLRQQDIVGRREFPDACVTTTWTIDLHYPKTPACACEAFQSEARNLKIEPYPIPYRCLYSRNIENLMMAGRNISVTHVTLGTVRVMRTGGMMGEVVGMAASLCTKHGTTPRGVYEKHLDELKQLMARGAL